MAEYENMIKDLANKINLQNDEINLLKENLNIKNDESVKLNINGKLGKIVNDNKNLPKAKKNYTCKPSNNYKNPNKNWRNDSFSHEEIIDNTQRRWTTNNNHNINNKLFFEECRVTRKIIYPNNKISAPYKPPMMDNHKYLFNEENFFDKPFPPHNISNKGFPQMKRNNKADSVQTVIIPQVLQMRQNQEPFIIERAYKCRSCVACQRKIFKNEMFVKHREMEAYPHHKLGWSQPLHSANYMMQFYHLNKNCLQLRGFQTNYLNLCYVTIDESLTNEDRNIVQKCGFLRPTSDQRSKDIHDAKETSIYQGLMNGSEEISLVDKDLIEKNKIEEFKNQNFPNSSLPDQNEEKKNNDEAKSDENNDSDDETSYEICN